MSEQEEFQSANVYFQENGINFRVVKQRYVKDTLQIIYVPDLALSKLDQTIFPNFQKHGFRGRFLPKCVHRSYLTTS